MLFFFFAAMLTCTSLFSCTPPDKDDELLPTSISAVHTGTGSRIQVRTHDSLKSTANDYFAHAQHNPQPATHATPQATTEYYFPWPGAVAIELKAAASVYRRLNESAEIYP